MKALRVLLIAALALVFHAGQAYADTDCIYTPPEGTTSYMPFSATLKHGVNLSQWWQDDQNRPITSNDIRQIHRLGMDFVRLPISPTWLELPDEAQRKEKLAELHCDIVSLLNEGLTVVVDMHANEAFQKELVAHPEELIVRVERLWDVMEDVLKGLPPWKLYLEIFNEPMVDSASWWRAQDKIITDLRRKFPDNTFVASPGPFNGWWYLTDSHPYKDENVIYDFHFYEPMVFTHHGADWTADDDKKVSKAPIAYPVDPNFHYDLSDPATQKYVNDNWNRQAIASIIKGVADWRNRDSQIKVVCFEFGVYRPYVDDKSRYNWLRDVRDALENYNIPWALWEYKGPFGIFDDHGVMDKGTAAVLGPKMILMQ